MTHGQTLGETEEAAIREAFAGLERDVDVLARARPGSDAGDAPRGRRPRARLERNRSRRRQSVCGLADGVRLTVVEHDEPGPWPRTTIGPGLVYQGMPLGYELTTLVHAIVEAGRAEPTLSAGSRERLATLAQDVAIDVFVTPT